MHDVLKKFDLSGRTVLVTGSSDGGVTATL